MKAAVLAGALRTLISGGTRLKSKPRSEICRWHIITQYAAKSEHDSATCSGQWRYTSKVSELSSHPFRNAHGASTAIMLACCSQLHRATELALTHGHRFELLKSELGTARS